MPAESVAEHYSIAVVLSLIKHICAELLDLK